MCNNYSRYSFLIQILIKKAYSFFLFFFTSEYITFEVEIGTHHYRNIVFYF